MKKTKWLIVALIAAAFALGTVSKGGFAYAEEAKKEATADNGVKADDSAKCEHCKRNKDHSEHKGGDCKDCQCKDKCDGEHCKDGKCATHKGKKARKAKKAGAEEKKAE